MAEGLQARDLSVVRAGRRVLDSVDFDLHAGEICTIGEPSGRGESTLLHALVGPVATASGTITLAGVDVHSIAATELRRRVGFVA